jgi:hypothetical protein
MSCFPLAGDSLTEEELADRFNPANAAGELADAAG